MHSLDDVIKAYDVRGLVPDQLDSTLARDIGTAFVQVVAGVDVGGPGKLVVGHDMRESGPALVDAFTDGALAAGADVVHIGLCSTDELYFASGSMDLPGAMFTASHNPARYNGIKLCRSGAAPVGQDTGLRDIKELVLSGVGDSDRRRGELSREDVLDAYGAYLRGLVDLGGMRPLKIVADAGNGMAGLTAPAVLGPLPIDLVEMYFELDGNFPNHEANPIDPANLRDLQAAVIEHGADLGLAFDGDADRCFVIDEQGRAVSPSTLTGLIAARELAKHPGSAVIHNLITSRSVPEVITENGGKPVRTRVGHSFIKATMAETGAVFGGEHSGHFYFRDFWRADSGMLAALHIIGALGQSEPETVLSQLLAPFDRYPMSGEINSTVSDPAAVIARLKRHYESDPEVRIDLLDGMTVASPRWWFNVRPSNTEPLLRLNVEGDDRETMERVRDEVLGRIRAGS